METSFTSPKTTGPFAKSLPLPRVPARFTVHSRGEIRIINFDEILCCRADGNYTMIYLNDGSKCMISKTLKYLESILQQPRFLRIHASNLVNVNCIKRLIKNHTYQVEMPFNLLLDISRSRQKLLLHRIEAMCAKVVPERKAES